MEPEPEDGNYELSLVTEDTWNDAITSTISSAFVSDTDDIQDLALALQLKAEISKFSTSIGSCTVSDIDDDLFTGPAHTTLDDLETIFSKDINTNLEISSTKATASKGINPKVLSKLWNIPENLLAKGAIDTTTQLNRQSADNSLSRHFSTNDRMLHYHRINSTFYTDTMFATDKVKSTRGNKACQVFVSDKGFVAVYPIVKASNFEDSLHLFCKEVGVPVNLIADPHPSQAKTSVRRFCDQMGTTLRLLEKSMQWANRAELYIGLLKEAVRKDRRFSNSPMSLWDYCIQRRAQIHNVTPRNLFQNDGQNPHSITFGNQADISNICNFQWYEWIHYHNHGVFPLNKEKLGRVLGPIKNEGNEMAQAVLTASGKVIPRRTLRRL